MSRFTTKQQLLDEIDSERHRLDVLLAEIPADDKAVVVTDAMTVKDFLAHRTEWGRMMLAWYDAARAGEVPAVPSERYKWNQLPALNAEILERFRDDPLDQVEAEYTRVHDELRARIAEMSEEELFTKHHYAFTGTSDLATYVNSASAAHYRSARKYIAKWWRARKATTPA